MNISFEYSRIPHLTKYSTNAQSKSKLIDQSCLVRNSIAIFTSQMIIASQRSFIMLPGSGFALLVSSLMIPFGLDILLGGRTNMPLSLRVMLSKGRKSGSGRNGFDSMAD